MASSENLASFEPFLFRRTFPDSWISEAYARDTETLTKALQRSLSSETADSIINPFLNIVSSETTTPPTPTASNFSGSEPETPSAAAAASPTPKRQRNGIPGPNGKVSKRKSRASKKSQTTFITADPANFRQMVQQVTGVRFSNSQLPIVPVLKPEAKRPVSRLHGAPGCLPTLDTSAYLLDHHQHQQQQQQMVVDRSGPSLVSFSQAVVADGGHDSGLDLDAFSSFPTLDSLKYMG